VSQGASSSNPGKVTTLEKPTLVTSFIRRSTQQRGERRYSLNEGKSALNVGSGGIFAMMRTHGGAKKGGTAINWD